MTDQPHIAELDRDVNWGMIPTYMHEGIRMWVELGIMPGDFLRSVFENDLKGAASHADDVNRRLLADYAMFVIYYTPALCQGSKKIVLDWAERGQEARESWQESGS